MGLPVWRAPSPEPRDALKADLSAPARSPIRRRSPFAARRSRSSRSPRSPRLLDHDFLLAASRADSSSRPSTDRRSFAPPAAPEVIHVPRAELYRPNGEIPLPPSFPSDDGSLARLRRDTIYRSMFDASAPAAFGETARMHRQPAALTPNFAPAAAVRNARPDGLSERERRSSFRNTASVVRISGPSWGERHHPENILIVEDGDDDHSDSNAVGFPPLRRMGRRSIADGPLPSSSLRESWSPTTLDGLGDRERSISPIDEQWDTMLSTVVQDPLAPSADSSFTSAAASASFSNSHPSSRAGSSNSNSAASSHTHLTVPSRRDSPPMEVFLRACDTSDDDTASDTDAEEVDLRPTHSFRRRHRTGFADAPPSRDPTRYSRGIRDRSREASAYVRSFYGTTSRSSNQPTTRPLLDQLDGPAEGNAEAELQPLDVDLRDARAFLERLVQREDLTDDFWAAVGLTRPLADRVERLQQRERM